MRADLATRPRARAAARTAARTPAGPPARVLVRDVRPRVDDGRYPIKRTPGETIEVLADAFADGHDRLAVTLLHRPAGSARWEGVPMESLGNDLWRATFTPNTVGLWEYTIEARVDRFATWSEDLRKRVEAGQEIEVELLEGASLVDAAAPHAPRAARARLLRAAQHLRGEAPPEERVQAALDPALREALRGVGDPRDAVVAEPVLRVRVDRERARFGAWYEMFPRSAGPEPGRHATLREAADRLPEIADMGFDVVYLPPVHPIGHTHRKGPNNVPGGGANGPGSPWAIGAAEGGHKSIHPGLGTMEDFDAFVARAESLGLEVALDIAFQCSPDHPYVREHPGWFRHRSDGSIRYAENPPKKYQDIYPLDFECEDWRGLWEELRSVVAFWADHGVRVFRVDNPHTKPFAFWEWLIAEIQRDRPDTVFLSEAFTRPKVMKTLAKVGFTQSYTYFTWRNTKGELADYLTELTQTDTREFLRPNLFANTPDILHEYLQTGGRAAFQARLVLAGTLAASYGIYGPAFELCEGRAVPGTEEYQDSEKYQVRAWDRDHPGHIRDLIVRVNAARHDNAALQFDHRLRFHPVDNDQLLCYSKSTPDLANLVLVVVNLDPHHVQTGWVRLPLPELGLPHDQPFQVHDLLGDGRYLWQGEVNFVQLDPHACPAHLFVVRRRIKTERDFDYYL